MAKPIVYGPTGSTYVRSVRLALEEKRAPYELVTMGFGEHKEMPHLARQPFAKVPAFEHDGLALYETQAIIRYVDEVFPGESLQPDDARGRARMNQIIGIVDAYAWPSIAAGILFQRLLVPRLGGTSDEAAIEAALPRARLSLKEIERLSGNGAYLAGDRVTLADLMVAPIIAYLPATPEGPGLLEPHPRLREWSARMAGRESMARTTPSFG